MQLQKLQQQVSQACDDWLCIHDHCKCVSINKSYKWHCIIQGFDLNLSFKVLVCFLLIGCSSLTSKLNLLGNCLSIVILRCSIPDAVTVTDISLSTYSDYAVFSNFTLAFFEDSGWYKVNYTFVNNYDQFELQWGRGI